jgi:beta-glucosidase
MKKIRWKQVILTAIYTVLTFSVSFADQKENGNIESRVEALLTSMTLDEKIGQMTQVDTSYLQYPGDVKKYFLGSVLSGGNSVPPKGIDPKSWADFIDSFQAQALKTRLAIPILYGLDAVHGNSKLYSAVIFPHNIGMGCTNDPDLMKRAARITAIESAAVGSYWVFAPCVAVSRDERWGRTYESFGEEPGIVGKMGAAEVEGLQGEKLSDPASVLACPKHFLGDGGTAIGTGVSLLDQGDMRVDENELRAIHLAPYIPALKEGALSIMASFSSWNGIKMHGNKDLLTGVLKGELGFRGFIVSDWKAIEQLEGNYDEQVAGAINAGIDMVMVPDKYESFIAVLKSGIDDGTIPLSRIDDAVRRILRVKMTMGLFDHPYANRKLLDSVGSPEHRAVAREAVRKSLVVLKNEGKILPLGDTMKTIYVVGQRGDDIGAQCGGWTINWQGAFGKTTVGTSILEGLKKNVPAGVNVVFSPDGNNLIKKEGSVCVAVVAEKPYAEYDGDSAAISMSDDDVAMIKRAKASGLPVVTVLLSGRPVLVGGIIEHSDALIAAWLPGTEGDGITDVLLGKFAPTGKLAMSWPRSVKQLPVNKGDKKYDPLFPVGYGLSWKIGK